MRNVFHQVLVVAAMILAFIPQARAADAVTSAAPPAAELPAPDRQADSVVRSFSRINEQVQESLAAPLTGDADQDFATGMIANQQAAIDMAGVVLKHGDDPEIRSLAQDIVRDQGREMKILKAWLERNTGQ
ncbi:MAG: DUF305 domain-containing protein [Pseudomonadota bacterium]|nr:DUF305 domain-containing protein [Pseudomonadota bacterium]